MASLHYESIILREELKIRELYSLHYFEYAKDFFFEGESHDFWEFLYVDSGNAIITADDQKMILQKNQLIFHKPNEFHAIQADGITAPNLIVVSFACDAACMNDFKNLIVSLNDAERFYLSQMLTEGRRAFCTPQNNPYTFKIERNEQQDFAAEQVIRASLEMLLISIYRRRQQQILPENEIRKENIYHPKLQRNGDELFREVISYLKCHIGEKLTISQICRDNSVGRTKLEKLFHEKAECGVVDYFNRMKIDTAQELIREKNYNYTQIACMLGYSSCQYFSQQFKKYTRMTPSQYNSSVISVMRLSE